MKAYAFSGDPAALDSWLAGAVENSLSYTLIPTDTGLVIVANQEPPEHDGEITKEAAMLAAPDSFKQAIEGLQE